ncbi:hypothetical protein CEXT_270531 [Caerostris extrusa]|uniref:Uncharacterized protein n=1 Tax=Caerostris extrusa TaxID=172846 RepID=A0AAV4XLD7_CAEEX|nr:hypothetical protein CEXT_270531 [Caerostris extrusa]
MNCVSYFQTEESYLFLCPSEAIATGRETLKNFTNKNREEEVVVVDLLRFEAGLQRSESIILKLLSKQRTAIGKFSCSIERTKTKIIRAVARDLTSPHLCRR